MGYCIKLISYKEIKEEDVKSIIFSLPYYLRGHLDEAKEQTWGWPCVCDIHKPQGKELMISGAYTMSGDKARDFTTYIQQELDKMGYDTSISYMDNVLFDEEMSKDTTNIKLYKKEEYPDIEEVELKFEYKKFCDAIVDFSDELMMAFKKLADAMLEYAKKIEKKRMEEQNNESND